MPDLPSLTVTGPQATRLLQSFGDAAGYKKWLKQALLDEVQRREARDLDEAHNEAKRAALLALRDELPAADAPTGEPAP
jgi:uncharacterized membrane protein YheB (UPF0754 family)